jgi:NarL family two-component system response regulator LiaR
MTSTEPIRLIIADDYNMIRKGLTSLLKHFNDIEVIAEAVDGKHAVQLCQEMQPDVVLMDLVMPRLTGIEATRQILERCPDTEIIILSSFQEEDDVQAALKAGAISYIIKNISSEELATTIRLAHEGESHLSPEVLQVLIHVTTRPPVVGHDLTDRERDVLNLMAKGLSNQDIADELVISLSTVKNHVSSILGKMGACSRTEAVALAVKHKVLQ